MRIQHAIQCEEQAAHPVMFLKEDRKKHKIKAKLCVDVFGQSAGCSVLNIRTEGTSLMFSEAGKKNLTLY